MATTEPYAKPSIRLRNDLEGGEDVWAFVNKHRIKHNAINHGQGFPNWSSPNFVKKAAQKAIENDHNQYAPNTGLLSLKQEIAKTTTILYGNKPFAQLKPTNIQITNGCAGALDSCFRAFLNPNDEVLAIEPFFTFYRTQVAQSQGILKTISLDLVNNEWKLNPSKLEKAITNKTRLLIINSPHNPTGYVMSMHEMQQIIDIIRKHPNILVITDEVYHYISSSKVHYFAAMAKDVFQRTINCCSAAKTFSVTGWKIGWCVGPENLIKYINFTARGHSWSVNTPCQQAIADILVEARLPYQGFSNYYKWLNNMYEGKRKLMLDAIKQSGMKPITPKGAYYIMVHAGEYIEILRKKGVFKELVLNDPTSYYDWQFVKWLIEKIGVATIPGSAFCDYSKFNKDSKFEYIRFAYCTADDTIKETAKRLQMIPKLLLPKASKL